MNMRSGLRANISVSFEKSIKESSSVRPVESPRRL